MKLKLTSEDHIDILSASDAITEKDISILKAGITKLFQNGKNKIVFELPGGGQERLAPEVIRELGMLDNFARELAGRIVVVSSSSEILAGIQAFASPPLVLCYATRKEALAVFAAPPPLDTVPGQPEALVDPLAPPLVAGLTKEDYLARELGDLGQIRKQLADAERDNRLLQEQIVRQVTDRRAVVGTDALHEKIVALEQEIEKLLYPPAKSK